MSRTKRIALSYIRTDGGTQSRAQLSMDVVGEYKDAINDGASFPAVVVFHDGSDNWLADGFHRYHGHKHAGKKDIECEVKQGTVRDAILFSVASNVSHGLRRTNADKRHAVMLLLKDKEWAAKSDRWIAETAGVHHTFAGKIRSELATVASSHNGQSAKRTTGRDGKSRKAPERKPTAEKQPPAKTPAPPEPTTLVEMKKALEQFVSDLLDGQPPHARQVMADWLESLAGKIRKGN